MNMNKNGAVLRSQALLEYGAKLEETNTELTAPEGTQVIVRVRHCGVCHSDVHLQDGYFDLGGDRKFGVSVLHNLPFTLGHEIEGEIVAAGPAAKDAAVGARVVVYPWIGCENCELCAGGNSQLCNQPRQIGINVDGGYATHVVVPHPRYVLDYGTLKPERAGSFMCAGLTAYGALKKLSSRTTKGPVLIMGLGGVGTMALQFARALFDAAPIVADIDPAKRTQALEAGAAMALDPLERDDRKRLMKATGGVLGAVDLAGTPDSLGFAMGALSKGGKVVIAGLIGGELRYPIPYFPFRSITVEGSYVGSLDEAKEMLALAASGAIDPIPVKLRPLDEAQASLDALREGGVHGRSVLTP